MPSAYCGECEWEYRVDGDEPGALSRAMIDHFVETGHSPVERDDVDERLEKCGHGAVATSSGGAESKPSPRRE
ncbi:hypothetical protein [Natrinema marinum]|uniref:hypothetical protein n=1 Tax=Natrinema marinum TaxID=2961598 RepID=UPI0020C896FC|nr:hypothetical protein [Natrinema marinum]